MKLITIVDEMPVFNPEIRTIAVFNKLLVRDKGTKGDHDGRKKSRATKELAFIHFWCVYDSRFESYEKGEKVDRIKELVDLPSNWKPDNDVKAAAVVYADLTYTPSMGLFKTAQKSLYKLDTFFDKLDIDSDSNKTNSGALVIKPKDVFDMVTAIPNAVRSLIDAENLIEKELDEKNSSKGSKELSFMDKGGSERKIEDNY